ncbi:MAG: hypothetical protein Sylvanvirus17_8 [Sylvanvirus sp.]|uniref:Uncharacterized protein n=1 Tax=Sylvanvirus sp. TaxID=2487774 RepID=A0A3G5ALW0_9VIRU|nr:MAG: hypothetical protein Sylvanvirus17_8 [Sylvanvirus sp.]
MRSPQFHMFDPPFFVRPQRYTQQFPLLRNDCGVLPQQQGGALGRSLNDRLVNNGQGVRMLGDFNSSDSALNFQPGISRVRVLLELVVKDI